VDIRERAAESRLLRELDRLPRPFDREASLTHVTGSAIVVGQRGIILHLHRLAGIWLQPGGHLEPGKALWEAALREATEETGIALTHAAGGHGLVHVDVFAAVRDHVHLDLRYLLTGADQDPEPPPGESPEVRWFGWDEAIEIADPSLTGALRALRPAAG
jgi:8-oxo-dGTP pyrophosphatase MutT (NUDIX family)